MILNKGCDLSTFQGNIDFSKLKNEVDFAIIRAGYGKSTTQKDNAFESYYKGCKDNGIKCGAYWYSYAMTEDEARQEAKACLEVIKGKQFEYPIYFDIEEEKQFRTLGKEKISAIIKAFCEEVEKAGYWVGVYSSASEFANSITDAVKTRFAVWVAHWGVAKPSFNGSYGMWQYSSTGHLSGINGNVDLDYCYFDYPTEIKKHGLNGYTYNSGNSEGNNSCKKISVTVEIDGKTYKGELKEV